MWKHKTQPRDQEGRRIDRGIRLPPGWPASGSAKQGSRMLLPKQSSQTSSTSPAQRDSEPVAARHCCGTNKAAPQCPAPSQLTQLSHHLHPCFLHLNDTGLKEPGGGKRGIQPLAASNEVILYPVKNTVSRKEGAFPSNVI